LPDAQRRASHGGVAHGGASMRPQPLAIDAFPVTASPLGRAELLWRICIADGELWTPGRSAGRWHHAGEPMLYAAATPALAAIEALAQRDAEDARKPHRIGCMEPPPGPWHIIDAAADVLESEALTRSIGSEWLARRDSPLLFVRSVLVPFEFNVLINTAHPAWQPQRLSCDERDWRFDPRLT
jgi:RES domain-containing protein